MKSRLFINNGLFSKSNFILIFLSLACLAVPLSSTGKSWCIVLSVCAIISSKECRSAIYSSIGELWCLSVIALFLIAFLACFWGVDRWPEQVSFLSKYSKLLYLPVLAAGFRDPRARIWGIHGILIAMLFTAVLACIRYMHPDFLSYWFKSSDASSVFRNHTMTSYMMSFATYLSAVRIITDKRLLFSVLYALLWLVFTINILVINTSMTGYVVYSLLMALWLVQYSSGFKLIIGVIFLSVILTLSVKDSRVVHTRVLQSADEFHGYYVTTNKADKNTSVGYRLQFHEYAKKLYLKHPLIGNGTGSFPVLYAVDQPVSSWGRGLTEPHSQYWLVASEWGLLGLLGIFAFFISLFIASWRLKDMRCTAIALLCSFMMCNISDSFLFYSGTGYFFILMMALCLGEA